MIRTNGNQNRWLNCCLLIGCIMSCIVPAYAQEQTESPESLWQKIVEANQPWLQPNPQPISYEIESSSTEGESQRTIQVDLDETNDNARVHGITEYYEGDVLFTDGLRADLGRGGQYEFNQTIPDPLRFGATIEPAILQAVNNGAMPESLQVIGPQSFDGRNVIVLEAPTWNQQVSAGIDVKGFIPGNYSQYDNEGVRWMVDADNYTLIREEAILPDTMKGVEYAWDFSAGYYKTEDGYAPKSIVWSGQNANHPEASNRLEFTFQLIDGKTWFLEKAEDFQNGKLINSSQVKSVSLDPIDASRFDLAAVGVTISEATQGTGVVKGHVLLRETQSPVQGASVKLFSSYTKTRKPLWGESVTDRNGTFQFTALPDLNYFVLAEKEGLVGILDNLQDQSPLLVEKIPYDSIRQSFTRIELTNGQEVQVDVELTHPRTIRGRVLDSDTNEPIPDATVGIEKSMIHNKSETELIQTDPEGRFEFDHLSASTVNVAAKKEGYYGADWTRENIRMMSGYPGDRNENIESVNLAKSEPKEEIVLKLQPGGSIIGIVKNTQDQPVSDAELRLNMSHPTHSNEDGSYQITGLGRIKNDEQREGYSLIAHASGYAHFVQNNIFVTSTEPVYVDVVLKQGGRITGIVRGTNDQALPGVAIRANHQPDFEQMRKQMSSGMTMGMYGGMGMYGMGGIGLLSDPLQDETDENGQYEIHSIAAGTYWIQAATDGYQPFVGMNLDIKDEAETHYDIQLTSIQPITGRVFSATGQPLDKIDLLLQVESDPQKEAAQGDPMAFFQRNAERVTPYTKSDSEGRFQFVQLNDIVYKLRATYHPKGKEELTKELTGIRPGQTDIEVRFDDPRERPDLKGKVVDASTGRPIDRFMLSFYNRVPISTRDTQLHDLAYGFRSINNASGEFFIKDMPIEPTEILICAPGYASQLIGPVDPDREINEAFVPLTKEGQIQTQTPDSETTDDTFRVFIAPHESANLNNINLIQSSGMRSFGLETNVNRDQIAIRRLPSGTYDLLTISTKSIASATCIQVTAGETTDTRLFPLKSFDTLHQQFEYRFMVQQPDGSPCPLLPVRIQFPMISHVEQETKTTDDQGRFSLTFIQFPESWRRALIHVGENPSLLYEMTIQPDENLIIYEKPQGSASLRGVVLQGSNPLAEIQTTLISVDETSQNRPVFQQKTNGLGRYAMNDIPAGRYRLLIGGQDRRKPESEFRWMEIDLEKNQSRFVQTDFYGPTLTGMVVNRNGEPMSGAYVQIGIPWETEGNYPSVLIYGPRRSVKANANGVFTFTNLQPGEYTLWASRYSHGVSQKQTITINEKDPLPIRLVLE